MSRGHDLNGLTRQVLFAAADQCSVAQRQGVNSAIRLLGQLLTSLVSTSVRYASGLTPCSLQVSTSEASIAQFSAPSSLPANRAFFLFRAIGRTLRSTVLESISMRPSSRKRTSPSQWLRPYRMAWAIDEPLATCTRIFSSQVFSVATRGLVFSCRTTRRSLALLPRILASIS